MQSLLYLLTSSPLFLCSCMITLVHVRGQNLQMVTILLINENIFQGFFVSNQWSIIPLQMFGDKGK